MPLTVRVVLLYKMASGEKSARWFVKLGEGSNQPGPVYTLSVAPNNLSLKPYDVILANPVHLIRLTEAQKKRMINKKFDVLTVELTDYQKGDCLAWFETESGHRKQLPVYYEQIPLPGKKYEYVYVQ